VIARIVIAIARTIASIAATMPTDRIGCWSMSNKYIKKRSNGALRIASRAINVAAT
jgi:hypothetical protein